MQLAGAAAGAYGMSYVGAVKAFEEAKITPAKYVGSSMGSIVGALWAAGVSTDEMPNVFTEMFNSYFMPMVVLLAAWDITTAWGVAASGGISNTLKKYLPQSWSGFKFPYFCIATDVSSGGTRLFGVGSNEEVPPYIAVAGSATVAPLMTPTKATIDSKVHYLIDGGFLDAYPVRYLDANANKVVMAPWGVGAQPDDANVELAGNGYTNIGNIGEYFMAIYNTMNGDATKSDLIDQQFKSIATGVSNVGSALDFSHWQDNIDLGYKNATAFITENAEYLNS